MKFDFTPRLTKVSFAHLCRQLKRTSRKLGQGAFAKVFQHPTKSTRVLKVNRCDSVLMEDGYYRFLKRITKLRGNNPFLPRVHSVKVFKRKLGFDPYDRSYEFYFVAELEKLVPFKKIKFKDRYEWYKRNIYSKTEIPRRGEAYADEMKLYCRPHQKHRNRALKRANKLINRTSRGIFFRDDHHGNLMWRVRASGMHVVFIDPVA